MNSLKFPSDSGHFHIEEENPIDSFKERILDEFRRFADIEPAPLSQAELSEETRRLIERICHLTENTPDRPRADLIKELRKRLYQTGHSARFDQDNNLRIELAWETKPPLQIPLGINGDPRIPEKDIVRSLEILHLLFEIENSAEKEGRTGNLVIYDTAQVTNYLNSFYTNDDQLPLASHIKQLAAQQGVTEEQVAHDLAYNSGEQNAEFYRTLIEYYQLHNIEVDTFSRIEQDPLYMAIRDEVVRIVESDEQLFNQLLKTVNSRYLKRAGIGLKMQPDNENADRIRRRLAEYSIKVVALHIYNLGETVSHDGEVRNYRLTRAITGNKEYRQNVVELFSRFGKAVNQYQLEDLQFPKPAFYKGFSLNEDSASEIYRLYTKKQAESLEGVRQILLSRNNSSWSLLMEADEKKRQKYLNEKLIPLIAGHYHYRYGVEGMEKLISAIETCDSLQNIVKLVQTEIVLPLTER